LGIIPPKLSLKKGGLNYPPLVKLPAHRTGLPGRVITFYIVGFHPRLQGGAFSRLSRKIIQCLLFSGFYRAQKKELLILMLCLLFGFFLRLYKFDPKTLWIDEAHTFNDARDDHAEL